MPCTETGLLEVAALEFLGELAALSVRHALGVGAPPAPAASAAALREHGASFVTLKQNAELRGCIGSLEAHRPLVDDVCLNAVAAALRDPRFAPLATRELGMTTAQVSVLSPASRMEFASEADLFRQLRPDIDGVILVCGRQRATYLPAVWQQLPDPKTFIGELRRKARIAVSRDTTSLEVWRYTTQHSTTLALS